jgi:gamma-glutamyl-gamma-aminobutyrate hydrolase PuuD
LGVCRGAQVLNVAVGGTLHQHLPDVVGNDRHRPAPALHGRVHVAVAPGSALAGVLGTDVDVPCYHHQSIDRLGDGLRATAWADDGTVEAVEMEGHDYALGVQWHPELDAHDLRLFESLVAAALRRRAAAPDQSPTEEQR